MAQRWQRVLLGAGSMLVMLLGAGAVVAAWEPTKPEDVGLAPGTPLIEIRDFGFNPPVCTVRTDTRVYVVNKTEQTQQIRGRDSEFMDIGPIAPGEVKTAWRITFPGTHYFYLESDPSKTGAVAITQSGGSNCTPAGPTATPTPTFTPSPTSTPMPTSTPPPISTATPTATPTPDSSRVVMPQLAREVAHGD